MIDRFILKDELNHSFFRLFLEFFLIILLLGLISSFFGANYIFLVMISAISLSYPVVKFIKDRESKKLNENKIKDTIFFLDEQILIFWILFLSATIAFWIVLPLLSSHSFHSSILDSIFMSITNVEFSFGEILVNNLSVALITFFIAFISTSGIVFVLIWNASILSYVLYNVGNIFENFPLLFGYLGHGLLEIAGFVLVGLAGSLLSYRFEWFQELKKDTNKTLIKDFLILISLGIFLIFLAAFFETL